MPIPSPLLRQALVLALAVGVFAISFGVLAEATGLSWQMACAMSVFVFGGGSQFAAVGVVAAGGSPVAAVAAGLLLNARYTPFGMAVAPSLRGGLAKRMLAAQLVIDESSALALGQSDPAVRERIFWVAGGAVFVCWNIGTAIGVLAGQALGDPRALGLDAAFPAGFLVLLGPLLRDAGAKRAALAGAVIAVALVPVTPPGVPILVAALAALTGLRRASRTPPAEPNLEPVA